MPSPQESVIGVVTARSGEGWRVDIGAAHNASLDGLAFEGATKKTLMIPIIRDHLQAYRYGTGTFAPASEIV